MGRRARDCRGQRLRALARRPAFHRAAAIPQAPSPSRDDTWRRDGDGHSAIYGPGPDSPIRWESRSLPLQFREFRDGLFVIDAVGDARRWIGARVLRFGAMPASDAVAALAAYVNHDNAMTVKWLGIHYSLPSLNVLHAIGAADTPTHAVLTLRTADGVQHRVRFEGGNHVLGFPRKLRALAAKGHNTRPTGGLGNAHALSIEYDRTGRPSRFVGVADSRGEGTARGPHGGRTRP